MIIKNEIELHKESEEYIKRIFDQYIEVERLEYPLKNPIIHMYPFQDTYKEDGELGGYVDAIFFKANIYDTKNKLVLKGDKLHDSIDFYGCEGNVIQFIRIFKDLSTLILFKGLVDFSLFQNIVVNEINE